ncbi:helix-turn-helix domain-containing protein [Tumebacillus sp. DT12]|uniref:Helix-turn-helix domain-containing protein n=1 Tax=Tumebacillus lacus TaxID=2995335 RepID=A0ABT3WZH2_9BACL|nr:helix-turn-helix domain-containing protein [Tumebacillus lacus]MCX7570054.1 helix-turn-helix domain-containing protein [Tumebacillus lacus]
MSRKGQKHITYSLDLKKQAVEMRLNGMTKKQVTEQLGIHDLDRLKVWMRKYKTEGEIGLIDQRGRREKYVDRERYIRKLEVENAALKKVLEIRMRRGRN